MPFSIDIVLPLLEKEVRGYQVPVVDLIAAQTEDPFHVLVATILSARTRDEVTAAACRKLFAVVHNPADLAGLSPAAIEGLIAPVGFYHNKALYLSQLPGALDTLFQGRIPDDVDSLVRLPGVGRKTANLVVAVAFKKPAICVDTHVHRICNIWGLVQTTTPLQTEMALREILPLRYWGKINSTLVAFGQGTCRPLYPHCDRCVIADMCPRLGVRPRRAPAEKRPKKRRGLRLVSWNVNGLRAVYKNGFFDAFHQLAPDILALQEIKALPDQLPDELLRVEGYHSYWWPARKKGYSGTAVYTRIEPVSVLYGLGEEGLDTEGRVLTLEFADFFLLNVYFPNAQDGLKRIDFKLEFNRTLQTWMTELARKKSVVLCGDLNVAHREIDLANPQANEKSPGYSPQERAWMDQFLVSGFVDTFRMFNQEPEQYTWWSYRSNARVRNIGWRIDYFVVDGASTERVAAAAIHDSIMGSDHCPVSLEWI